MTQEIGETRDAIIEDDQRLIQDILNANADRTEKYWIVMFAKASKNSVDGKPTLIKYVKAYSTKPAPKVGMIVAEVDNQTGEMKWDVNMPQAPIDYDALGELGAEGSNELVTETTSIPNAYITK